MPEFTALHFTDTGDDLDKYRAVQQFAAGHKDALDAVFFTGDFIDGHPTGKGSTVERMLEHFNQYLPQEEMQEVLQRMEQFAQEHRLRSQEDFNRLPDWAKTEFQSLQQRILAIQQQATDQHKEELPQPLTEIVNDSYRAIAGVLREMPVPVYALLGNHDLTLGYEILEGAGVKFVERQPKIVARGRSGVEFILKGDNNTWEVPAPYQNHPAIALAVSPHLINYSSGHTAGEFEQMLAEIEEKYGSERKVLAPGEKNNANPKQKPPLDERTKAMKEELERAREAVREYCGAQQRRMGKAENVDIYLSHKTPHNQESQPNSAPSYCGDTTLQYSQHAKVVHGGHFHDGQVGLHNLVHDIADKDGNLVRKGILASLRKEATETASIDGVEVPVIYLDAGEPWELNPGSEHFFVTEYSREKQIEAVTVYEFVYG